MSRRPPFYLVYLCLTSFQKCILATKEEWRAEEREDANETHTLLSGGGGGGPSKVYNRSPPASPPTKRRHHHPKGARAWYNAQSPPFALWVCGRDNLVDGDKLLRRFEGGREPHARLVHRTVIPEYEHLDVLWAMDAETRVFAEVREVLWRTVEEEVRARCRVPTGCEGVEVWVDDRKESGRRQQEEDEDEDEDGEESSSSEGLSG